MPKPQRLPGQRLEMTIEQIEDPHVRDVMFELLMRTREAVNPLLERVAALNRTIEQLRRDGSVN